MQSIFDGASKQQVDDWERMCETLQNAGMSRRVLHAFAREVAWKTEYHNDEIIYATRKTLEYYKRLQAQLAMTRYCFLHLGTFNEWALRVVDGEYDELLSCFRNFGPKSMAEFKTVLGRVADPSVLYYAMYI